VKKTLDFIDWASEFDIRGGIYYFALADNTTNSVLLVPRLGGEEPDGDPKETSNKRPDNEHPEVCPVTRDDSRAE
jgi:hypothetical protein